MNPQALLDLGMEHHRAGRFRDAEVIYRHLLQIAPGSADVMQLLGVLAHDCGHSREAADLIEQAIQQNPAKADYHSNLGLALTALGEWDRADAAFREAQRLNPRLAQAFSNHAIVLARMHREEEAIAANQTALALWPEAMTASINLGNLLAQAGRLDEAIAVLRLAIGHAPQVFQLRSNLGLFLLRHGDYDAARAELEAAVQLEPRNVQARCNLASVFAEAGDVDSAVQILEGVVAEGGGDSGTHSNLVFLRYMHRHSDRAAIEAEHRRWAVRFEAPRAAAQRPHENDRTADRRLRIGYLSGDLRAHASASFVLPLLESHDHTAVEVHAFSTGAGADECTERFRRAVDFWHPVAELDEVALAARIRVERIDILVDLVMHASNDRLLVLARKPAPVQVTWMGHPGTTGLQSIDYRFTDATLEPPGGTDAYSSEEPVRLPHAWCSYLPPADAPPVNPLPALSGSPFTFGSLNHVQKLNPAVLGLWAALLAAAPTTRLQILARAGSHRDGILRHFTSRGIDPERIGFLPPRPRGEYLRYFHGIDVALDPFPYNGHTTTCEALWMGVPVLSLVGRMAPGRMGLSLLSAAGLTDFAAPSEAEFLQRGRALPAQLEPLAALRAGLRERMKNSPLLDATDFARSVESAYRDMWRRWTARPAAGPACTPG